MIDVIWLSKRPRQSTSSSFDLLSNPCSIRLVFFFFYCRRLRRCRLCSLLLPFPSSFLACCCWRSGFLLYCLFWRRWRDLFFFVVFVLRLFFLLLLSLFYVPFHNLFYDLKTLSSWHDMGVFNPERSTRKDIGSTDGKNSCLQFRNKFEVKQTQTLF